MGKIVVGIDGSTGAERAFHWALEEAKLRGSDLRVVHTFRISWPYYTDLPVASAAFSPAALEDAAEETVETLVASVEDTGEVEIDAKVISHPNPAEALIDESRDADLVVVGSRGLGGFAELLLGSVSHQVAQHAACPVVIVPAQE